MSDEQLDVRTDEGDRGANGDSQEAAAKAARAMLIRRLRSELRAKEEEAFRSIDLLVKKRGFLGFTTSTS